jgi:hypothetical protein
MQPISKQLISKHASNTIDLLLEMVFSIRSVQSGYKEKNWGNQFSFQGVHQSAICTQLSTFRMYTII